MKLIITRNNDYQREKWATGTRIKTIVGNFFFFSNGTEITETYFDFQVEIDFNDPFLFNWEPQEIRDFKNRKIGTLYGIREYFILDKQEKV